MRVELSVKGWPTNADSDDAMALRVISGLLALMLARRDVTSVNVNVAHRMAGWRDELNGTDPAQAQLAEGG